MNKNIWIYIAIAIIVGLVGYNVIKQPKTEDISKDDNSLGYGGDENQEQIDSMNRGNCLADDCLLVEDLEYPVGELPADVQNALSEAINDEYKALTTYQAVISELGSARPFSMIIGAEEQHIASLKTIYDKYGVEVPGNTWFNQVSAPATLKEACQVGVDAEIANAALYRDELIPAVTEYEDITAVFINLMNASQEKHLPAFERCN